MSFRKENVIIQGENNDPWITHKQLFDIDFI